MQFDCDGNLYVYEPEAGCSGTPRKIPQGFTQEDLDFTGSSKSTDGWNRFPSIAQQDVHRIVTKNPIKTLTMRKSSR